MITNPSAKQRFLQNAIAVSQHQEMVHSAIFQQSADAALLEYQEQLQFRETGAQDLNKAAGNYLRLLGAREFLLIIRNLGEKETPMPKTVDRINLETRSS